MSQSLRFHKSCCDHIEHNWLVTQVVVSLYWVYCWRIIQQCMLVVDNFYVKIQYTYTHFFHWSIHASRCIVVLSVLLDDYTIVYACYWSFSFKNPKHLYTFLSYVFKSCIGFVLSYCVNEKNVYTFSYGFQKLYWFHVIKLFECQKKIHLEYEIHNTA